MKRVLITCSIFLLSILVLCFIPFNIDKFIPNITQKIQSEYGISINTNHLKFQIGPYLIIKSNLFPHSVPFMIKRAIFSIATAHGFRYTERKKEG